MQVVTAAVHCCVQRKRGRKTGQTDKKKRKPRADKGKKRRRMDVRPPPPAGPLPGARGSVAGSGSRLPWSTQLKGYALRVFDQYGGNATRAVAALLRECPDEFGKGRGGVANAAPISSQNLGILHAFDASYQDLAVNEASRLFKNLATAGQTPEVSNVPCEPVGGSSPDRAFGFGNDGDSVFQSELALAGGEVLAGAELVAWEALSERNAMAIVLHTLEKTGVAAKVVPRIELEHANAEALRQTKAAAVAAADAPYELPAEFSLLCDQCGTQLAFEVPTFFDLLQANYSPEHAVDALGPAPCCRSLLLRELENIPSRADVISAALGADPLFCAFFEAQGEQDGGGADAEAVEVEGSPAQGAAEEKGEEEEEADAEDGSDSDADEWEEEEEEEEEADAEDEPADAVGAAPFAAPPPARFKIKLSGESVKVEGHGWTGTAQGGGAQATFEPF